MFLIFSIGRRCVVLFDYDPYRSSTSDHPERELKLREGDYVTVYGEMDVDGYLEAEVDGEWNHGYFSEATVIRFHNILIKLSILKFFFVTFL